jgi:hypothetical protein
MAMKTKAGLKQTVVALQRGKKKKKNQKQETPWH